MIASTLPVEDINALNPERVRKVWAQRAARLAQVPEEEEEGDQLSLVLIQLGQEIYGLEAQYVLDIRPVTHITPVPRTPEWVVGVVNLRGQIISVLDLHSFLNLPRTRTETEMPDTLKATGQESAYLIVIEAADLELALFTDDVLAVQSVSLNQVQDVVNTMILNIRSDYVRGIVPHSQKEPAKASTTRAPQSRADNKAMLVILDLPALLTDKRLIIEEELKG